METAEGTSFLLRAIVFISHAFAGVSVAGGAALASLAALALVRYAIRFDRVRADIRGAAEEGISNRFADLPVEFCG